MCLCKKMFVFCWAILVTTVMNAQQEAQSLMYAYNPLMYNGAYASVKESVSLELHLNKQWVNVEGTPMTCVFTGSAPLWNTGVGVGLSFSHQSIGINEHSNLQSQLAYRVRLMEKSLLAFSVGGECLWHNTNDSKLANSKEDDLSEALYESGINYAAQFSLWCENPHWSLSFSMKGIGNKKRADNLCSQVPHAYLSFSTMFPIEKKYDVRMEFIAMGTENSPLAFQIVPNLDCEDRWNVGLLYEIDHYVGAMFKAFVCEHFYLGGAYSYALNDLATADASSSFELMLGFKFPTKQEPLTW